MAHPGARKLHESGTVCWTELATKNAEQSRAFYSQLFDWQSEVEDMEGMLYTQFKIGSNPVAGMLEMNEEWGDIPAHWMTYFAVDDCDAMAPCTRVYTTRPRRRRRRQRRQQRGR
eukprot:TRINITY_DN10307_c0_g1_i1.p1 TRINITY_DN10307_c0_g1~~TRINITY_DN10307_c0_g1_i1.p1  ORF type:complete len:123 (-),score=30.11 TRINITY_DN10307_c0_g1_i1:6-350(-)